ncbi:sugar phosphate isomerase/epimerase family protein [Cohnella fermenti]|nr:sugar phosphate isomerase/epimerase family protein [Cohnella fermenti]
MASALGFCYLELGIGGDYAGRLSREMSPADAHRVKECVKDYGLTAPFVCLENDFTLEDRSDLLEMIERTKREIALCHELGATHVRLFTGFELAERMTEDRWRWLLGAFREAEALCASFGIEIAIETHGQLTPEGEGFVHRHTTSTDWGSLQRLLRELPPRIGINFDPGNLKPVGGRPLTDYARLLDGRINYCHLKDWKRTGDCWTACGVGDDDIDWDALLAAMSYDGVYLIEYEPTHDVEDGIVRSLNHLRKLRTVSMR